MNDTLKNIFQTLSENAEENFIKNKNAEDYLGTAESVAQRSSSDCLSVF